MIKHIVMWKLKDSAEGHTREENMKIIKEKLEGLVGRIDGLIEVEIGVNFNPNGFDLCLNSKFESKEALEFYDSHPLHQEVRKYIRSVINERVLVDYE
jgi:hypothetical protein